jgi:hypothetical protein
MAELASAFGDFEFGHSLVASLVHMQFGVLLLHHAFRP